MDFLVTKDKKPWFLVEVKSGSAKALNPELAYFQSQIKAEHAFQVVSRLPFVTRDCFEHLSPLIVPRHVPVAVSLNPNLISFPPKILLHSLFQNFFE
ncbi:MAG: hypothetical protein MZU91_07090 [Desulfosudis oleivorans]|nr:hypothetical protein [Desulfosudis oleivorans]